VHRPGKWAGQSFTRMQPESEHCRSGTRGARRCRAERLKAKYLSVIYLFSSVISKQQKSRETLYLNAHGSLWAEKGPAIHLLSVETPVILLIICSSSVSREN